MIGKSVLLVLLIAGVVLGEPQIGTFEGVYLSSSYGYNTYICQDGISATGSYDEAGIFTGEVDSFGTYKGQWFEAGTGACQYGDFEIYLTADGFDGWYSCPDGSKLDWAESKTSVFRPTDTQCAMLYESAGDIEGHWVGTISGFTDATADICFGDDKDVTSSYVRGGVYGYEDLRYGFGGLVSWGTWYEDLNAGAVLYFTNKQGTITSWWWTGLVGLQGNTVIDTKDYNDPNRHGIDSLTSRVKTTTYECGRYVALRYYVLKNAQVYEDDFDGFYFLPDNFHADWWWFGYGAYPIYIYDSPSSASTLIASTLVMLSAALMFVL